MDIILQNYTIEAKNFLFFDISKYIKNITMDFIDNLFRSDNKYIAIINSLTKAVRELVKAIILSSIKFLIKNLLKMSIDVENGILMLGMIIAALT